MVGSGSGGSFLRQFSGRDNFNSSKRWSRKGPERSMKHMEGLNMMNGENGVVLRKRVMVVVDQSTRSKHAMMWALTHVANKGDLLTLLEIIPPHKDQRKSAHFSGSSSFSSSTHLANSLGAVCKSCKPEVSVLKPKNPHGRAQQKWDKLEFWGFIFLLFYLGFFSIFFFYQIQ